MGVGNFLGMMPDSMKESNLYGVELDSISGRIAKQLYPHANIQICGFKKKTQTDIYFFLLIIYVVCKKKGGGENTIGTNS